MIKINLKKILINFTIILFIFLTDRISKIYILKIAELDNTVDIFLTPYLNLYLIWNKGIAFGLLNFDESFIYHIIRLLMILFIVPLMLKIIEKKA